MFNSKLFKNSKSGKFVKLIFFLDFLSETFDRFLKRLKDFPFKSFIIFDPFCQNEMTADE